jgi:hypothetical protein
MVTHFEDSLAYGNPRVVSRAGTLRDPRFLPNFFMKVATANDDFCCDTHIQSRATSARDIG